MSETPPPYSLIPHPSNTSNAHTPQTQAQAQAQTQTRVPPPLSEFTIDSIPGNIFNGFKNTLLFYDFPRNSNSNSKGREFSGPVFEMSIKGLERITCMVLVLCGGGEGKKEEGNVLVGGAQLDKFNKQVEVQQVGVEGLQREMESGMRGFGTGKEGRWEWKVPSSFDGDENSRGKDGKDGKERILIWQHKIPNSSLAPSFTNPNLELRDKISGDLYAVIRYNVWKRKDMVGIQFRRRWEDGGGGRRKDGEEEDGNGRAKREWNFQLGVLITGCVVVERERQRRRRRGTIGMGLIVGMVSG
ncbi:hypothetical protein OCU04_011855 [Sclerotinia nivalis]|uniref:Uncharacterized protein n=1 Tax=Sclerotinia nivalis TaxID=352851 RepID=A0A9X0A9Z2_9HELO|nr:hypothetical protein OCU04_011855 [Sclerotinia nivalis]